jgi:uncharacterized RDD family membrane protein YckC
MAGGQQHAEFGQRAIAIIVDTIIMAVLIAVVTSLLAVTILGGAGFSPGTIFAAGLTLQVVALAVGLGYFIVLEASGGQTLGKKLVSIKVVDERGRDIGWGASVIRNLLRIVDALPTLYIIGIVLILLSDDDQRLGDMVANTSVVKV